MNTFDAEVSDLVERVAALEPPPNVARIQDDFVAAATLSAHRVSEINDQVTAGQVPCGQQLNDLLYGMRSSDQAEQAISELEKHGYFLRGQ